MTKLEYQLLTHLIEQRIEVIKETRLNFEYRLLVLNEHAASTVMDTMLEEITSLVALKLKLKDLYESQASN